MASIYPLPNIKVEKNHPTYTVHVSVDSDTNVYYQPTSYKISIINNTFGGYLSNVTDVTMVNRRYVFTSYGDEELVISVSALFSSGTETTSVINYTTELVPIRKITVSSLFGTMTDNDDLETFKVTNLTITPANASVLYGTRPKVIYEITPVRKTDTMSTGISVDSAGIIHTVNATPGEYNVKIMPADGVKTKRASAMGSFVITKPVSEVKIYGNETDTPQRDFVIIPSDGNGGYEDLTFTFDKAIVLPTDATERRLTYELHTVVRMPGGQWIEGNPDPTKLNIGKYSGEVYIDHTMQPTSGSAPYYCKIYAYSLENNSIYAIHEFLIYREGSGFHWTDRYDTCPQIITTMDFNAINFNVQYLREKTGLATYVNYVKTTDDMTEAKSAFESLFASVRDIIDNGVVVDYFGESIPVKTLIGVSDSTGIPGSVDNTVSFAYAPSQAQWNILLDYMKQIYDVIPVI